ncbi:hypothetical protein M011DRAFT_324733 [Sporormia fimetaria CBS 119925]|uniref:Copper acquisition factor BIM1-like domain-containing protein n=1 Tax=Sporormia fimetaria CBS 119925 TaxID=1340428 RepID=A0A6A6VEP6_9PLEO|nr:hypothetical protein M011DRAFT_324733 [Sporormia fimetaria CBS 119925]
MHLSALPQTLLPLFLLPLTAHAHFKLAYPTARGWDTKTATSFPCGGFDSVKEPRTPWPINGGPVQLRMDHTQTRVQVLMALGEDPGSNFNIVVRPTFAQEGLGDFCVGALSVPEGVNVTDGTLATIQVVANGHADGGLYQCADVILTSEALSESDYNDNCKNGTTKVIEENIAGSPNGTAGHGGDDDHSGSNTEEESQPPASSPTGAAAVYRGVSWVMGAVGVAAFMLV